MRTKAAAAIVAALLTSSCRGSDNPESRADHPNQAAAVANSDNTPRPSIATSTAPPPSPTESPTTAARTTPARTPPGSAGPDREQDASQSEGAPSGSVADPTVQSAVMLAPAAGTYTYATRGYSESGSGPTRRRTDLPATTTDHVDVTSHERGKTVTVTTDFGDGSTQHVVLEVTETEVHLTRLASTSTTAGVRSEQAVNPQPPILVVRAPYRVGDSWESSWQDHTLGVQGIGTGAIVRSESLATPAGHFETAVVKLDHRLRGSVTGRLQLTLWIDPSNATRVRDETVIDLAGAGAASHSESARELTAFTP